MRLWSKLFASLLVALWLPATLHCDLEAAGVDFLTHEDHASSPCRDTCVDDSCHAIEGTSFTKELTTPRVLPPDALGVIVLLLAPPPTIAEAPPALPRRASPEWLALHRTWSFVLRAALPARAPDTVA